MSINFVEDDVDALFRLYMRIIDMHESGELSQICVVAVFVNITKLASGADKSPFLELLYKMKALDLLIFKVTRTPAQRAR